MLNPLAYRVLLMLPNIYRLWGRARLEHLQPWVKKWATEDTLAGVEGKGPAGAAYTTALLVEYCSLKKIPFSGGAADIHKCFHQIQRPYFKNCWKKLGCPQESSGHARIS